MSDAPPVRVDWDAPIRWTWALVGLLVAVHVVTAGIEAWFGREALWAGLLLDRPVWFRVAAGGKHLARLPDEPWRLVTSVLLHGNLVHLALNTIAVGALGRLLEPWIGGPRFAAWFVAGGVLGSALSVLAGVRMSDGASGGAFALLGGAVVVGGRLRLRLDADDRRLLGPVLGGFLAVNVVLSFVLPFVDAAAHIGGLATGLALAAAIDLDGTPPWQGRVSVRIAEVALLGATALVCAAGWAGAWP